jgi:hypothetical protein
VSGGNNIQINARTLLQMLLGLSLLAARWWIKATSTIQWHSSLASSRRW